MTIFDGAVFLVVLISSLLGLWRGLTKEILSLFSWIGAAWATLLALPFAHSLALKVTSNPLWALIGAAVLVFVMCLIILLLASDALVGCIKESFLSSVDRGLGGVLGFFRGLFFVGLAYWVSLFFLSPIHLTPYTQDSLTAPWIEARVVNIQQTIKEENMMASFLTFFKKKIAPLLEKSVEAQSSV